MESPPTIPRRGLSVFLGQSFAAGNGDLDDDVVQACAKALGGFAYGEPDHLSGNGVDGGLARRDGEARLGHHADPFARAENNPRAGRAPANGRFDKDAMRHVRIVACVFNDARCGARAIVSQIATAKDGRPPPGSSISTVAGHSPVTSASQAARAAAAAQAPVVHPRRRGGFGSLSEFVRPPLIAFPVSSHHIARF